MMILLFGEHHLADTMEALALTELVLHFAGAFFRLLETAHGARVLPVAEVNAAQVEVGTIQIFQKVVFPGGTEVRYPQNCFGPTMTMKSFSFMN